MRKSGWNDERKEKHAQLIRAWKPWEKATGPKSEDGKSRVSKNAFKGGHRPAFRELVKAIKTEIKLQNGE